MENIIQPTLSAQQRKVAQAIAAQADAGGVIQASGMAALSRTGVLPVEPSLHCATLLRDAWACAGLPANTAELMYG